MKIVINKCYGGFGLSPLAVKTIAKRQGKSCFFFTHNYNDEGNEYMPVTGLPEGLFWTAFSVPNPDEVLISQKTWHKMTQEEKEKSNALYESIELDSRYDRENRSNPLLVSVVEELGSAADGSCADLAIVEIPDGTEYTIEEYDGLEHVAEAHRTWA